VRAGQSTTAEAAAHHSGMTTIHLVPEDIRASYAVYEWRNASGILQTAHPEEWADILAMLRAFEFRRSELLRGGGAKSSIAARVDALLGERGWMERKFMTKIKVDNVERDSPTHKVDCYKNGVGLEIEWNNKDPFYDRDLNNFRLLFDLRTIEAGVILTRTTGLRTLFRSFGQKVAKKYGASTTHLAKLLPRIEGGGGGGCPILVFGITEAKYRDDGPIEPEQSDLSVVDDGDDE
jgi:hypothetical protein